MLRDLIANQQLVFSKSLYATGQIESILNDLKSKGDLLTAILMLEEKDRSLLLFILQDDLYACVELYENTFSPLAFSDYFKRMSQAQGAIHLYFTNPIFFKVLLVLAQKKPSVVATTDILNIEGLLEQVQKKKKEAILMLRKGVETNIFYFRKGRLSEGFFEKPEELANDGALQDQFLVYTYSSDREDPMEIQLYYDLDISPATDVDEAIEALGEGVEQRLASCPRLILKQTEEDIEKILDKGVFTLGRDLRGDFVIKDPMASREHALIIQSPDGFYIEDRGSRNGTFVNKEKVDRKKLMNEDEIQIGSSLFTYIEKDAQEMPEAASLPPIRKESLSLKKEKEQSTERWALEFLSGKEVGITFELPPRRLSMGRVKSDVTVDDPKVSRHHADLEWTAEGFMLIDLKSTNGVYVNDSKIEKKLLSENDIITVGETRLRVICKQ